MLLGLGKRAQKLRDLIFVFSDAGNVTKISGGEAFFEGRYSASRRLRMENDVVLLAFGRLDKGRGFLSIIPQHKNMRQTKSSINLSPCRKSVTTIT